MGKLIFAFCKKTKKVLKSWLSLRSQQPGQASSAGYRLLPLIFKLTFYDVALHQDLGKPQLKKGKATEDHHQELHVNSAQHREQECGRPGLVRIKEVTII